MSEKLEIQTLEAASQLFKAGKETLRIVNPADAAGLTDKPFAVIPVGFQIADLEKFLPTKEKTSQTFATPESFAAYVERFKRPEMIVFNSLKSGVITAIFDFHTTGKGGEGNHLAAYKPEHSREFIAWKRVIDGGFIGQAAFAEFLQEFGHTVTTPDEASIVDMVESVQATMNAEAKSVSRSKDGSGGFGFQVKVTLKSGQSGELDIPDSIVISLPIYTGGALVDFRLKVQVRVAEGGIKFRFIAPKLDETIREFNAKAVETVAGTIGATIYAQP